MNCSWALYGHTEEKTGKHLERITILKAPPPPPVRPGELAYLTQLDPTLEHARKAATETPPLSYTGSRFSWCDNLLYCWEGEKP